MKSLKQLFSFLRDRTKSPKESARSFANSLTKSEKRNILQLLKQIRQDEDKYA